ncbi:MAG TPA: BatD family protein, partial [Candidatus Polarisedimenticolaceae bacterium]|nr:BatD family protein [Candidatus Polarisedimenticolaceae bacterium]
MSGGLRRLGPLVVLGLYLSAAPAWAQQPFTVETVVEPDSGLSDTAPFHIVLHITGQQPPGIVQPEPFPLIDGLSVVNGPNTNRRFFWRDGEASATYQLSYVVIAERPGRYTVPSLGVEIDGRDYRTEPLTFEVGRGRDGSRGVSPSGTIGQPRQQADPVFFEIKLGEDEVWVGQPVPLSVTLYSAYRVTGVVFGETPGFPDFWVEQVEVDADAERFQTRIDGRLYTGYPVDRRMLIPLAPGAFTIEPYVGQVQVRQSGAGDRFDFFSFGRTHTVVRKTPELEVHVKPLPPGQPAGFSGAVGRFTIDVRADRDRARVNDAVALRATVEGEGSLQSVAPPTLVEPTGAKLFEPTVTES